LRFGAVVLFVWVGTCLFSNETEVASDWDEIFTRRDGWTGADGAYSVDLEDGRTLWLYSDSWVGSVRDGKHAPGSTIVNNTIGVGRFETKGDRATVRDLRFHWGPKNEKGKPTAWIVPDAEAIGAKQPTGWYWILDGEVVRPKKGPAKLVFFLAHIAKTPGGKGVWGFESRGGAIATVSNFEKDVVEWRVEQHPLPHAIGKRDLRAKDGQIETSWGVALYDDGKEFVYVYGIRETAPLNKELLIARAPPESIERATTWAFYDGKSWVADSRRAAPIAGGLVNELTVDRLRIGDRERLVLCHSQPVFGNGIFLRTAERPEGPWSKQHEIYRIPNLSREAKHFPYAAKAHAHLSRAGELLVTYVVNSHDFWKMVGDASIYRPRFLRVPLRRDLADLRGLPPPRASWAGREIPKTGDCPKELAGFDDLMTDLIRKNNLPGGALAVVRDGRLVVARGYGFADRERETRVEPESLFRIASLSKPITAVAILQLVEEGKLSLDTKIDALLSPKPFFEVKQPLDSRLREITVEQLLLHTAGFDRSVSFDPMFQSVRIAKAMGKTPPAEPEDVISFVWGRSLDFTPGERYAYSNFGYSLLGRAIEKVTSSSYEEYVRQHVFRPIGIHRARIGASLASGRLDDEVTYHDPLERKGPSVVAGEDVALFDAVLRPYGVWYQESLDAHGGWVASAVDLARFACAFDDPDDCAILSAKSIERMWKRPTGSAGFRREGEPRETYYAYGWRVRPKSEGRLSNEWHTGSLAGTSTLMVRRFDGLAWVALFHQRLTRDGKHIAVVIDRLLHPVANAVETWPDVDFFAKYPFEP